MQQEAEMAKQIFEESEADLVSKLGQVKDQLKSDGQNNYAKEMKAHRNRFFRAQEVEKLVVIIMTEL